jgi:hypothetical protein
MELTNRQLLTDLHAYCMRGGPHSWAGSFAFNALCGWAVARGLIDARFTDRSVPIDDLTAAVSSALASLTTQEN